MTNNRLVAEIQVINKYQNPNFKWTGFIWNLLIGHLFVIWALSLGFFAEKQALAFDILNVIFI
jgi:hypothetical protein